PGFVGVGLLPPPLMPAHSCVPNTQLETVYCRGAPGQGEETALRVGLLLLRDVRAGEELFAPRVSLHRPRAQRQAELEDCFGICCRCPRCTFEEEQES
ncbi:unnamed protein product, partial [Discosporangium mesarthrocarpum]